MSQYEFEGNHDGEWDDNEDIAWNESDWQNFLRNSDKEIAKFTTAYNQVKTSPDRLDETAVLMGWHRDDWSSTEVIEWEEDENSQIRPIDFDEINNLDPYTIHRHPVFISSSALFSYLRAAWEHFMRENEKLPDSSLSWSYGSSLADSERHCVLAASCLDLGDFLLAVCHLKKLTPP